MVEPLVVHSDLELFLTTWYRAALAARDEPELEGFEVDNKEPAEDADFPARLLVIRDDSGPGDLFTAERSIGLSVLMDSRDNAKDAKRALAIILGLLRTVPAPDVPGQDPRNPIAAVLETTGPFAVAEAQDRARQYATAVLVVTPEPL